MFPACAVRPNMSCVEDRERSLACYRATPLIHTGHTYPEGTLTETGAD